MDKYHRNLIPVEIKSAVTEEVIVYRKNSVYSDIDIARQNLAGYVQQVKESCCIYRVQYGTWPDVQIEYVFRKLSELLDKKSPNIMLTQEFIPVNKYVEIKRKYGSKYKNHV